MVMMTRQRNIISNGVGCAVTRGILFTPGEEVNLLSFIVSLSLSLFGCENRKIIEAADVLRAKEWRTLFCSAHPFSYIICERR